MSDHEEPASQGPSDRLPIDPDVSARLDDVRRDAASRFWPQVRRTLANRWDILLVIAAGGAVGSLARWALGEALAAQRGSFPWATFLENVSGGFALGVLMVFVVDFWPRSRYVRPFLGVGVLGGFTTFSTYLLDTRRLVVADESLLAVVYLFGSLAVGLGAVWLGIATGRLSTARTSEEKQRS
jgi:fluoride exporter